MTSVIKLSIVPKVFLEETDSRTVIDNLKSLFKRSARKSGEKRKVTTRDNIRLSNLRKITLLGLQKHFVKQQEVFVVN